MTALNSGSRRLVIGQIAAALLAHVLMAGLLLVYMKAVVELSMDFARDFGLELAALTQLAYDLYTLTMVYSG